MLHNILRWEDAHGKAVKLNLCRHRLILVELKSLNLEYPSDGATWWWQKDTVAITQEYWNLMDRSITKTWVENKKQQQYLGDTQKGPHATIKKTLVKREYAAQKPSPALPH